MSMYGLVFGDRSAAYPAIPALLGDIDVGRYRNVWFEQDSDVSVILAVYTRNGGGNREEYAEQIEAMQAHPFYLEDEDDSFDSTYATFRFRIPRATLVEAAGVEGAKTVIKDVAERRDPSAAWEEAIDALKKETPR